MAKQVRFKCLRCGYEYSLPQSEPSEPQERTCPRCRSNSVRLVEEKSSQG